MRRSRASIGVMRRATPTCTRHDRNQHPRTEAFAHRLLAQVDGCFPGTPTPATPAAARRASSRIVRAPGRPRRAGSRRTRWRRRVRARSQTSMFTIFLIQATPTSEQAQRAAQHDEADTGSDQQPDVVGVRSEHVHRDPHGQQREDPGREPAFSGEDSDLPAHHGPLTQRVGHVVQDLGQVAADLTLDVDGEDGPSEVVAADAFGERLERILGGTAQSDLGDDTLELDARGLGDLLGHGVQGLHEAVAGPKRARHDGEHVGQLIAQLLGALLHRHRGAPSHGPAPATTPTKIAM